MEWLINNAGLILGVIATGLSALISFFVTSKTKGTNAGIATALQIIYKMLPSLITTSENVNKGQTGEAKKAFVMTFVENTLAGRGITMTEALKAEISKNIDEIVTATKNMHTGAQNEENKRHDISGVTGLRIEP